MATFFIQTDKDFYFSGQTVNGNIFVNVGSFITGATGISLRFSGYQCVKWVEATRLYRPQKHNDPNRPQPIDPIELIPKNQIFHSDAPIVVSDPQSQDNKEFDHRPKYIRTSRDEHFKMAYYETRNMFTKNKSMIYQCSGFQPGQYSFPFSFKTFEGWPASFSHITPRKKGVIIYHMTVAIQPISPQFQMKFSRQITLRQTRMIKSQTKSSQGQITSCCCINKGISSTDILFEKDGFMPGDLVQMVIQIDNSQCTANINWINVGISNTVTMRSSGASTSDTFTVHRKQLNGLAARLTAKGNQAIKQSFQLKDSDSIKPTCSGKLLSSTYTLGIGMDHDINCACCSQKIGGSIPIIIFPSMRAYNMPSMFQTNWQPQMMPATNMALQNNFNNFNMASMGSAQSYPPQNMPPQNMPPQNMPPQNYPPQNYPPQNMPPQNMPPQNNFNQLPQNNFNQPANNFNQPQQNNFNQAPQNNFNQPGNKFNQPPIMGMGMGPNEQEGMMMQQQYNNTNMGLNPYQQQGY